MKPENFDIDEVISTLNGTCNSIVGTLQTMYGDDISEDDLTKEDYDKIDSEIFECSTCNWWCSVDEQRDSEQGEPICEDCFNELNEGYEEE